MCLCVKEREEQERRGDHNILLSHLLHHKSYFSNCHSAVPAQREGGWNKDMKAMRKKREKGRRRGELKQPGSVGWSENMRQNGYHLIPQRLRSTAHNISYCKRHTIARGGVTFLVTQWGDPHLLQDHFCSTIRFCYARVSRATVQAQLPHFCTLCPTLRQICIHNS